MPFSFNSPSTSFFKLTSLRSGGRFRHSPLTASPSCGDRIAGCRRVRPPTFGRIRHAGFALLGTFDHPHFTLVLADLSEFTLARLDRCFDEAIPNPGRPPEG